MLSLVEETHLTSVFLSEDRDQKGPERSSSKEAKVQKNFFGNKEKTGGAWVCKSPQQRNKDHTIKVTLKELHTTSLQFAFLRFIFLVFTGRALCGDTLPLGCEREPRDSNTSAELAGTMLRNISETPRQKRQTNKPPNPPSQNVF